MRRPARHRHLGQPRRRPASRRRPRTRPTGVRGPGSAPPQGRGCAAPRRRVIHRPEHPVHDVGCGVSHAGAWVNRDQAAHRAAIEHVARMKVPMQQHGLDGIAGKPSRELLAPSEAIDRNRASHHLATPAMPLNPVLEDELNPRRERRPAVRYDRYAAAPPSSASGVSLSTAGHPSARRHRTTSEVLPRQQRHQRPVPSALPGQRLLRGAAPTMARLAPNRTRRRPRVASSVGEEKSTRPRCHRQSPLEVRGIAARQDRSRSAYGPLACRR